MTNSIFEESLAAVHRGHAAGKNAVEKAASQLVSDVKYKVNKELGPATNLNPAQVAQKYQQKLNSSDAPPTVKALAKRKLSGGGLKEEHNIGKLAQESVINALNKVFVEGIEEEIEDNEYLLQLEEIEEKKYWIVVTDKKTGNTYRRPATRAKIAELRANPNIARVEMTQYHPNEKDDVRGQKTARVKSGKGLDPVGHEDADVNNDRKVDNTDKYLQNRRNVRGAAIAAKRGVAEEFIGEVKNTKNEKKVTGNGVNNYSGKKAVVKVFPNMQEQSQIMPPDKNQKPATDVVDPNKQRQLSTLQQFQRKEQQLNQQKLAAQKSGKLPVGSVQMNSYELEGQSLSEKSLSVNQQQAAGAALAAKRGEIDPSELKGSSLQMYKSMTEKQLRDFAKTKHKGLPEKVDESNCGCEDEKEPKLKKSEGGAEDSREIPTKVNLVKNKLRAMGLKMSYEPEGEVLGEGPEDRVNDERLMSGGVGAGRGSSRPSTGPSKPRTSAEREAAAQRSSDATTKAVNLVRQSIIAKHGKDSLR
jgi:hypothetical protein